jgi:hypothetical protein
MHDAIRSVLTAMASDPLTEGPLRLRSRLDGPASEDEIRAVWAERSLPYAAQQLWLAARSAELCVDIDYGQWGLRLFDPRVSRERTEIEQRGYRASDFEEGDVVIGEFLGDSDLLLLDAAGTVRVALPLDLRNDWYVPAEGLVQFLNRYRMAAGAKFWEHPLT